MSSTYGPISARNGGNRADPRNPSRWPVVDGGFLPGLGVVVRHPHAERLEVAAGCRALDGDREGHLLAGLDPAVQAGDRVETGRGDRELGDGVTGRLLRGERPARVDPGG